VQRRLSTEFVYQIFALLAAFIVVHGAYVTLIRPQAEAQRAEQAERRQENPNYEPERSMYIVLKDFEQEANLVLMLWALAIMGYKAVQIHRQQRQLDLDLLGGKADIVTPHEVPAMISDIDRRIPARERSYLLPRALTTALERFVVTRRVQDAAHAAKEVSGEEGERMESELSIVRYIAWAIPSIGFIGTVRGIGQALQQAHQAVEGDISGVTQNLGTAFNSTFVALVLSIFLMFLIHQLQRAQERLVLDTEKYCEANLVRYLRSDIPG